MAKKTLGKYEIIDRLGRGGMAEVYRAYHASLDRYVAIKLLHPFLADDSEFKDRFEREAQNIAKLRHPHIVQVFDFDFDEVGESYYMVMELIEGRTLKDILFDLASTGQRMSYDRAVEIAIEAAQALSYAHKRSMIHRDVKPANLMIEEGDGRVVLTDFGIARIVTGAHFTASGGMIGTPAYMSPEQGMGDSGDERSDLYSLGVIMFQILTGQLPYDADTPLAIILKHLNEPLPAPRTLNPDIPEWLEQVVVKTLEKEPGDRYANADELIAALEAQQVQAAVPKAVVIAEPDPIEGDTLVPSAKIPTPLSQTGTLYPLGSTQPIMVNGGSNWVPIITSLVIVVGVIAMLGIVLGQGGRGPLATLFATTVPTEVAIITTDTPTFTATFTDTPSPTATYTDTATATATFTDTPSYTPTYTDTATATFTDTPSPTATYTDTPTATYTLTPTATFTDTPSPTATYTDTPTATYTLTPSNTPTPNLTATQEVALAATATATTTAATATAQALADIFATQRAITPTLDIQRVLETCELDYVIIEPEGLGDPPNANDTRNPRLVRNGSEWALDITLYNASTCNWPTNLVYLYFVDNAEADISALDDGCEANRTFVDHNLTRFQIPRVSLAQLLPGVEEVAEGEQITITLNAQAGDRFGCYFGVWELRIPDYGLFIGDPFIIGYRGFGGG